MPRNRRRSRSASRSNVKVTINEPSTKTVLKPKRRRSYRPIPGVTGLASGRGAISMRQFNTKSVRDSLPSLPTPPPGLIARDSKRAARASQSRTARIGNKSNVPNLMTLRKVMRPDSFSLLETMLSPGEAQMAHGYPDNETTRSLPQLKIMDNQAFKRPTRFTADLWSCVFLSVPSPEIAGFMFSFDGVLENDTPIAWSSLSHFNALWDAQVIYWRDLTAVTHTPRGRTPALGNNDFTTVAELAPTAASNITAGVYAWTATAGTDIDRSVESSRKIAGSSTFYLVANMTANQGTCYSLNLSNKIALEQVQTESTLWESATTSLPPIGVAANCTARCWNIGCLPVDLEGAIEPPHFFGPATKGTYCIERWNKHPAYGSVTAERGCIAYSVADHPDTYMLADVPASVVAPDGTTTINSFLPLSILVDPSRYPTLTAYVGLAQTAYPSGKLVGIFENVPRTSGPLTYYASTPPTMDGNFLSIAEAVAPLIPPGADADSNGFWDTLRDIGSTVWEVIKFAAPIAMAFI